MAIDKLLQYDSRPDETGEALVHPATGSLEKTASRVHPDVRSHISEAPAPPSNMMRLLITALSSHDTFGPNKNGDGFYRQDLLHDVDYGEHPDADGRLRIPMYKSFQHFARPYKHHINSDSSPAYGKVERAFFNPQMDRVELSALLDTQKAPDIARRIRNYEPVKTSMGFRASYDECLAPSERVQTPDGLKKIEDVSVGDKVLTHQGHYKPVKRTFQQEASKPMVRIKGNGVGKPMHVTDNHPVWVINRDKVRYPSGRARDNPDWSPEFVEAKDVDTADYLVRNVREFSDDRDVPNEAAYLMGQYLGDGCISGAKNDNGSEETIVITVHGEDYDIQDKIYQSVQALRRRGWEIDCLSFYDQDRSYRDKHAKKNAVSVRIHCSRLADLCQEICGRRRKKRLDESVLDLSKEAARHLIGGYVDADGSYDSDKGSVRTVSVLDELAATMQDLMVAAGFPASQWRDEFGTSYKESGFDSKHDYANVLYISKTRSWKLGPYSVKVPGDEPETPHRKSFYFKYEGNKYLACRVKKVSVEADHDVDRVYNLSVADDHTYTVRHFITHNCSVCGNKAKSRREYCKHLKDDMLSVRPDGHVIHARNPKGKFFDISFVGTPADGTSRAVHVGRLPVTDGEGLNEKNKATGDLEDGYRSAEEPTEEVSEEMPEDASGGGSTEEGSTEEGNADEPSDKEARRSFAKAACAGWAGSQEVVLSSDIARANGLEGNDPIPLRKEAEPAVPEAKSAESGKESAIDKRVEGETHGADLSPEKQQKIDQLVERIRGQAPMIQSQVLERLSGYPMETVASTMATAGISLRPEEMQHIALTKAGAPSLSRRMWKEGFYLVPAKGTEEKTADIGLEIGPGKTNGRLLDKIANDSELMSQRSFRIGPLIERFSGPDKTAAGPLGPNPYLRHREPITPMRAREMATQEEQNQMRRRKIGDEPKQASMLEYIAHLIMGSEFNHGQVPNKQRQSLRSSYRQPRRGRMVRQRRMRGRPRDGGMMTMPIANYMQGTSARQPVYGSSGVADHAMSKESSLRKEAAIYCKAVADAMGRMDKVASEQVQYVIDSPEDYEAPDVEAAILRRADAASQ